MVDFFISVSGKDKTWGDWIAWQPRDAGYTFRYQHWDFQIGENFLRHMTNAGSRSLNLCCRLTSQATSHS